MSSKKIRHKRDSFFNMYFTSTISIALALFVIGLIVFLLMWGRSASNYTKENLVIIVELNDGVEQEDLDRISGYLSSSDFVKRQTYISKEQALEEYITELGDDPTDFIGFNPLKATIEINLKAEYVNRDSIGDIVSKLKNYTFVEDAVYQKTMMDDLNANVKKISFVLLIISAVLLAIAILLINNTIRISIYSKRFVINTMKLVGAKAWFIRKPFLWRFVKNGLVASLIASLGVFALGFYLKQFDQLLPLYDYNFFVPILLSIFCIGFLISFFASLFGINRYIKTNSNELYYI